MDTGKKNSTSYSSPIKYTIEKSGSISGGNWQSCLIATCVGAKSEFPVCQLGGATPTEGWGLLPQGPIEGHWQA